MADIQHEFPIFVSAARVYEGLTTPAGLDSWWTKRSAGVPTEGTEYDLGFGDGYEWKARVVRAVPEKEFELELTVADPDWVGSRVGFALAEKGTMTTVRFHHAGWPNENEHWRVSTFCWAMYLRILKRNLEHGETVEYERRLDV